MEFVVIIVAFILWAVCLWLIGFLQRKSLRVSYSCIDHVYHYRHWYAWIPNAFFGLFELIKLVL